MDDGISCHHSSDHNINLVLFFFFFYHEIHLGNGTIVLGKWRIHYKNPRHIHKDVQEIETRVENGLEIKL